MRRPLDFGSHHKAAVLENIAFLRDQGMADEAIAKRLGLKVDSLQRKEERARGKSGTKPVRPAEQS